MKDYKRSPTIKPLGCPPWSTEHESNRTRTHELVHHAVGHDHAYLEPHDFDILKAPDAAALVRRPKSREQRKCVWCGNRLGGRLATFSYRKAFSINQFQTIWDRAYSALARADRWLFIGYSMPEADFEFKHLLKAAQLARPRGSKVSIDVVLMKDPDAEKRYRGYFGSGIGTIKQCGLQIWVKTDLDDWVNENARMS